MRKSTIFISVALTTFMLAILFGVASAYQNTIASTAQSVAAALPQAGAVEMANLSAPTSALPANITPQQAADLAAKVLGRTDLYSVENAQLEGADTYLVTFSSGDLVYVSLEGQILSISKLPVTIINQPVSNGGGGSDSSGQSSVGYEDDDEHED